jgi:hypothetical protein
MDIGSKIENVIIDFEPITLDQMDRVQLMRRTDTKFVFNIKHLPGLLKKATDKYMMVEIEGEREQIYVTTYFDTNNYTMYHLHHNGKLNRHKVRVRKYIYSKHEFLEIKKKNNKGETIKKRIEHDEDDPNLNFLSHDDFIGKFSPFESNSLEPTLGNKFIRLTLVNKDYSERITLDYNIKFTDLKYKNEISQNDICIAEIKKGRYDNSSPFIDYLKELRINPVGFSKYCMGMAMLNPEVKNNNFKQKIRQLVKL